MPSDHTKGQRRTDAAADPTLNTTWVLAWLEELDTRPSEARRLELATCLARALHRWMMIDEEHLRHALQDRREIEREGP